VDASALDSGATSLLSEEMQDGLIIHSLQILNPFSEKFDMARLGTLRAISPSQARAESFANLIERTLRTGRLCDLT